MEVECERRHRSADRVGPNLAVMRCVNVRLVAHQVTTWHIGRLPREITENRFALLLEVRNRPFIVCPPENVEPPAKLM